MTSSPRGQGGVGGVVGPRVVVAAVAGAAGVVGGGVAQGGPAPPPAPEQAPQRAGGKGLRRLRKTCLRNIVRYNVKAQGESCPSNLAA